MAKAVRDLREAGIDHISFDLMYVLPGQTTDDVYETIAQEMLLHPDRIAMFGYAHLPSLLPRQRAIRTEDLPGEEARFAQSERAYALLTGEGYRAIGFDHFCAAGRQPGRRPTEGRLRRNFQGFTDEPGDAVIGLGASAISQYDALLVQNEKHEAAYRKAVTTGALAGCRGVSRTAEDRMRWEAIHTSCATGGSIWRRWPIAMAAFPRRSHPPFPCCASSSLPG